MTGPGKAAGFLNFSKRNLKARFFNSKGYEELELVSFGEIKASGG